MKTLGVIASRYASTRFPGKALADIGGKPMVWWTYRQAKMSKKLDQLIVATDDMRIKEECEKYEIDVIMTSKDHKTTASRMLEVSGKIEADFYITINGDEPMIDPQAIDAAILKTIPGDIEYGTNTISIFDDPVDVMDPSNIKVVFNEKLEALYMSRFPIPYPYGTLDYQYYKHIGVIGYNKKMLEFYRDSFPGKLERVEGIDTLRFIDYGKKLQFVIADIEKSLSVDTPKDLEKVCMLMKERGMIE